MAPTYEIPLTDLIELRLHATEAQVVTWQGRRALRLNGLALIPGVSLLEGSLQVQVGCEGPAYAGIAFRAADVCNYELAYAQPHTSGQWDALQYDPVFHDSNTWQLYHGPAAQLIADIPTLQWFKLKLDFKEHWARIQIDDQPPLVANRLAHAPAAGLVGIWSYLPAYFRDLRIIDEHPQEPEDLQQVQLISPLGVITEWLLEGYGVVECEPNGILNLNRYLPVKMEEARLTHQIEALAETQVEIDFGFSDELTLLLDDQTLFSGQNLFKGITPNWDERGYVSLSHKINHTLTPGVHNLTAILKVTEYFGWGMILTLRGESIRLSPGDFRKMV